MRDITISINVLNNSAKHSQKDKFITQSTAIIEYVRLFLLATGSRKDAPHRAMKQNHKAVTNTLAKLFLHTKSASTLWPPPDAILKMQHSANEVLIAVRHFIAAAQDHGIEIRDVKDATAEHTKASRFPHLHASQSSISDNQLLITQNNFERVAQLEGLLNSIEIKISILQKLSKSKDFNHKEFIPQVREMVKEVGNFLTLVDEIPMDSLNEEVTVDFKVNRLSLYNSIAGLVSATQTATAQFAPSNAIEQVFLSSGLVQKAVKDLLLSTKILIEEQESLEQANLADILIKERRPSSVFAPRQTKALSVSALGRRNNEYATDSQTDITSHEDSNVDFPLSPVSVPSLFSSGGYQEENFVQGGPPPNINPPKIPVNAKKQFTAISTSAKIFPNGPRSAGVSAELPYDLDDFSDSEQERKNTTKEERATKIKQILGVETVPLISNELDQSFLAHDYQTFELLFTNEKKVKGGTLEALVERLTAHDASDPNYMSAFLLTYRSFTTSEELFRLLHRRFTLKPPPGLTEENLERWKRDKLENIRTRIYNVFKNWVEKYWLNDGEEFRTLNEIKDMAQAVIKPIQETEAKRLILLCEQRAQSRESGNLKKIKGAPTGFIPPPILPKSLKKIIFLELDPIEIARQLTIMISKLYEIVQPIELLKKAWTDLSNSNAKNVRAMIQTSNHITGWVVHTVLNESRQKERTTIVRHFIHIAENCRLLNNFDTLMAILSGLEAAPIHRLRKTWDSLKGREKSIFTTLRELMTSTKNFSRYREELKSCTPPCIPFVGFFFTDLTFIEDGNPDFIKGTKLINFAKRMKTAEVINDFQQYQLSFALAEVSEIQEFLKNSWQVEADEKASYERSCDLEIRESDEEKITRMLQESG
ncbi:hypothetical protein HK096_003415, partial [Nowakowskiella sp. JEL0078]